MKSFRNFIISEEVDLTANVERGVMNVDDHAVRNNINSFLNGELACNVVTPYVAFNKVNKVLANFHIFLPKAPYMEDEQGVHVFNIKQFGKVAGMRNDGSVVTRIEQPYHLYFEWKRNERGMFNVFAEVVTDEELADLIDAATDDVMDAEDYRDEKIYEEKEEKEIKKAYKAASKDANHPKVGAHLKAAAKAVKKKLERGEKIEEAEDPIANIIKNDQARKSMDKLIDKKAVKPFAPMKFGATEGSPATQKVPSTQMKEEEKKTQGQMLADMAKKKREESKRKKKLLGLDEMWGDKVPKSERPGYSKDPSDGKWKPTQQIKKKKLKEALNEASNLLKKKL